MIIALSGTPGCGKTAAAKILRKKGFLHVDLNKIIRKEKLYCGYDKNRKTYIADMKKVEKFIKRFIKENQSKSIIIDSHLSHLLSPRLIDTTIILRCNPATLANRLKKKRWNKNKIKENCEAELIGVISFEARKQKRHKHIYEIDTTRLTPSQTVKTIEKICAGRGNKYKKQIDWLAKL